MKKSLFRKYNSGEEDIVIEIIEQMGIGALSPERKSEVIPVITDMMLRVKYNIDILHERLVLVHLAFKINFIFAPCKIILLILRTLEHT